MLCGMILGRLTRNVHFFGQFEKLILPSILLLLFLLGTGIGANRQIMESLPQLGLSALLLAVGGMAGTILCIRLITPLLTKKTSGKRQNYK